MKPRNKWIPGLAVVAVMLLALYAGVHWIDQDERVYFQRGQALSKALDHWARGLREHDFSVLQQLYSTRFEGQPLGLSTPPLSHEEHGILAYTFLGEADAIAREEALQEWRAYLEEFASIEDARAHIVLLPQWSDGDSLEASVRLTLWGRRGEPEVTVIDRMVLAVTTASSPVGLRFTSMRLISGERLAGQALFEDLTQGSRLAPELQGDLGEQDGPGAEAKPLRAGAAPAAGETNAPQGNAVGNSGGSEAAADALPSAKAGSSYAMARYWGHGITAGDYDGDGWIDLFLPGTAPRLMRNDGRGRFIDVTRQAGLDGLGPVRLGHLIDYDNDGERDLFIVLESASGPDAAAAGGLGGPRLLGNNGDGTFADITGRSGLGKSCCITAAAWADYDNDGNLDLYLGRHLDPAGDAPSSVYSRNGQPNQLWRNNGDGTFRETASTAGVGDSGLCLGTAWGDIDNDNRPDLWVVNDFGRSLLFRNLGQGRFADVSDRLGFPAFGSGHSAAIADYDGDGRLDLFAGRVLSPQSWYGEGPTVPAFMLSSLRRRSLSQAFSLFYQVATQAGSEAAKVFTPRQKGGLLLAARPGEQGSGDSPGFADTTFSARLLEPGWIWSGAFGDLDSDGDQDLVLTAGGRPGPSGSGIELDFLHAAVHRPADFASGRLFDPRHWGGRAWFGDDRGQLLINDGEGVFREIGVPAGVAPDGQTRGLAVADFDGDGRLDLAFSRLSGPPLLLSNRIPLDGDGPDSNSQEDQEGGNHWIILHLVGRDSPRDAVGARVWLTAAGRVQIREVEAGSGYASQNMLWLHFGLGQTDTIDEIRIRWPRSGQTQALNPLGADRRYRITEGSAQAESF